MDVKNAVHTAIDYVKDLYEENSLRDLLLEEVEFSESVDQWMVTVGFSLSEEKEESSSLITPSRASRAPSRRYKVVNVDNKTGQPISMKMRTVQSA